VSDEPETLDDSRISQALDELRSLVLQHYPDATFEVAPAPDDPTIVHLLTYVDLEDTDELVDLIIDRMVDMQVDEGLPVYVIPLRTPERIAAMLHAQQPRRYVIG